MTDTTPTTPTPRTGATTTDSRAAGLDYTGAVLDAYATARWYGHRVPRTFTDDAGHQWASRPDQYGRLVWVRPDGLGGQYAIDGNGAGRMRWTVQHRPAGRTWAEAPTWTEHGAPAWSTIGDARAELAAEAASHQASAEAFHAAVLAEDTEAADALGMTLDQLHSIDDTARHGSVWACTDCTLYLVNGEPPVDQDDTEHARWSTAVHASLERLGHLFSFDYDDSDTDPATVAAVKRWGSGRRDFDTSDCAVCGSKLAGERHRFSLDAD